MKRSISYCELVLEGTPIHLLWLIAHPPEENQHGYTSLVKTNVSKCLCFFFSVDHKLQVAFTTWYPLNQTYQLSVLNKLKLQTET